MIYLPLVVQTYELLTMEEHQLSALLFLHIQWRTGIGPEKSEIIKIKNCIHWAMFGQRSLTIQNIILRRHLGNKCKILHASITEC